MEHIIENIYRSCDEKNADFVPVSSLIEFIKPYMLDNLNELVKLRTKLDPDNVDPCIHYSHFQTVMSDWIINIQADNSNHNLSDIPVNLNQTFSSSVSCDIKSNNNNGLSEEEIQNLKLQLNKATAELDLVKQQLTACEEQNESLMADLNYCHKKQEKQCTTEHFNENDHEDENCEENTIANNKKFEQLQHMLSKSGKQQKKYLAQISYLENENLHLKNKLQSFEKIREDSRRSLREMQDCLDLKETEIATLLEVIENQKSEMEEKIDLLNFHMNEHKLSKQRIRDLESLLQNNACYHFISNTQESKFSHNFEHVFNTPKLLNQLANPVTPTLCYPLLQGFGASSPLKNSSSDSRNGSSCELFSNTSVVAMLKSPHKTLREELEEIPCERTSKVDEFDNFYNVMRGEEDIKNNLWHKMKELSADNETLLDYKKEYFDLVFKLQEKDEFLRIMKHELQILREKEIDFQLIQKLYKNDGYIKLLTLELIGVEDNLKEQKLINTNLLKQIESFGDALGRKIFETKDQFIQQLSNELKVFKANFYKEKLLNASLYKKLVIKNLTINQASQTNDTDVDWWTRKVVPEQTEPKKNNFVKQQMKIDRLLEKQEKLQKDLSNEKGINTKLTMKCQEIYIENEKIKKDLDTCHKNLLDQTSSLRELNSERNSLLKNLEILKIKNVNLEREIGRSKDEFDTLKCEKRVLDEVLQSISNRLAIEASSNNNLRIENDILRKKQYQLEGNIKEEFVHLKKHLTDLKVLHREKVKLLQDELVEKRTEIRTLKKQFEIFNLEFFVSSCNEKLHRAILNFFRFFEFNDDWIRNLPNVGHFQNSNNESMLSLENEMSTLNANIKLVVLLLKRIGEKQLSCSQETGTRSETSEEVFTVNSDEESDEISVSKDASFSSCFSDISYSAPEISEIVTLESDSFLESLQLEHIDYRSVSLKEMEEKFATLALLLTVDVPTLKKRSVNEKEKLQKSIFIFFSCLNCSIHLLNKLNGSFEKNNAVKTVVTYLRQLKDASQDMLKSAFHCGVLHYEKRTLDCWKLVINYVAILSQEDKQLKE